MTEYVVLIVGDEDRWWTSTTEEERRHAYAEHGRFSEQLVARGHRITGGAELHRRTTARTVPAGGGTPTDGPFTETAEQVGGFYLVESEDVDDLLDCCQILAALGDAVEVRPCVDAAERPS
jgi:hypothetical protein